MLLIVLAILTMLGTVIMSLAISNYNMKVINSKSKRNFYYAESGIEEAYGIMGDIVDEAIVEGNNAVNNFMDWLDVNIDTITNNIENEIDDPNNIYLNKDGSLNVEEIVKTQNERFKISYKSYITSGNRLLNEVINIDNYNIDLEGIKPNIIISPGNVSFDSDDKFEFKITSTFKHDNIEKRVVGKYEITVPEYNTPYYTESFVQAINRNIGWSKAIATEGDMKIYGGTVDVDGTVYIKGRNNNLGGISTIESNTALIIKGHVVSQRNIQVLSSDSEIQVKGNVYADNFLISDKDINNNIIQNSILSVNINGELEGDITGSVYTFDDLTLNTNYINEYEEERIQGLKEYIREVNFLGVSESKVEDVGLDVDGEQKTLSYWVNFSNLPKNLQTPIVQSDRELVILDGRNRNYAIIGLNGNETNIPHNVQKVYLGTDEFIKGLIITEGDIYFCGDIKYKGTIISNNDIYFMDNRYKKIIYDENIVARLIVKEENYDVLNNVFNDNYDNVIEITTDANIQSSNTGTGIVRDKLIKLKAWNIVR